MESENHSLDYALRYRKPLDGGYKDIENEFYSNDSLNDDLESKFRKKVHGS